MQHWQGCGKMRNMKRPNFSWKYAVLIVGLVVIAYLVMNFNSRNLTCAAYRFSVRPSTARLEGLESTQALLQTQIARATSEAAVIEWAYQEGKTWCAQGIIR